MTLPAHLADLYQAATRGRDPASEAPLRAAMDELAARGDNDGVAWVCHALSFLAVSRGDLPAAGQLVDRALALVVDGDGLLRAKLLNTRAALMLEQDHWPGAIAPLIAVSRMEAEYPLEAFRARQNLGFCLLGLRDHDGAVARFRACLALCPDRGSNRAMLILGICVAAARSGDLETAHATAGGLAGLVGEDPRGEQQVVLARSVVGAEIAAAEGRWLDVRSHADAGLPLAASLSRISIQAQLGRLASHASEALGDRASARRRIDEALALPIGPDERLDVLRLAADLACRDGELETTIRLQREALDSLRHDGTVGRTVAQVMERAADGIDRRELELSAANDALGRAYASLDKLRCQLEQRVEERTRDLAHEVGVRRRAEEAAVRASDGKSRFLANMSHELRTPLNAIIGYAEILEEDLEPSLGADAVAIRRSGRHLLEMIDQVLELTRIDTGDSEVRPARVALGPLLARIAADAEPRARGNRLVVALGPFDAPFRTDPARLRQIVDHLLDNAAKFTERGTITLFARRDPDGLEIRVADTGPGIEPEHLAQVFEPFHQVDPTSTRRHGGSGLGLALCRRIAIRLGGTVTVDSEVGVGSTFVLRVPELP